MIAVDTSALMAILLDEASADVCIAAIESEDKPLISAGTISEALIVAQRRDIEEQMTALINGLGFDIESITPAAARRVAAAYAKWGKGVHPAGLNFGDCFAYEIAKENGCPLLYVSNDFARTDLVGVI